MQIEKLAKDLRERADREGRYSQETIDTFSDERIIEVYNRCPCCGFHKIPPGGELWCVIGNCVDTEDFLKAWEAYSCQGDEFRWREIKLFTSEWQKAMQLKVLVNETEVYCASGLDRHKTNCDILYAVAKYLGEGYIHRLLRDKHVS
jgi:hypothetical protein